MNKLKLGTILLIVCLYGCVNLNIGKGEIELIKIYSVPFTVLSPVPTGDDWVNHHEPILITDSIFIESIIEEMNNLSPITGRFNKNDIYLRAYLYKSNGDSIQLDYNKFMFQIQGQSYAKSERLLKLISSR